MRYGKIIVYIFSVLLLAIVIIFGMEETEWNGKVLITAVITADDRTEEITCWEKSPDEYIFFLPSYADLSQVRLHTNTHNTVRINNQIISDKVSCEVFQLDTSYNMIYDGEGGPHHFKIMFMQSANIASMYIDVPSGSMDYIHELKGNEESGNICLYTPEGEISYYGRIESIKGRGNFTWYFPKKSYSVNLSAEADLLEMGEAKRWILLSNANDSSQLRNKIAYDFARNAGMAYSPDCEWVDLYLNGEYVGLYLLSERNEVHSQRVDIAQDNSFLVSQELGERVADQGHPYVFVKDVRAMRIHYSTLSTYEMEQIWRSVDNAILSEDGIDPISGKSWLELIDLDSWVMRYLLDECLGNYDGGYISQFFYWHGENEKIYAGPVWDMDNSLGCGGWFASSPNALLACRPHYRDETDEPFFNALCQKKIFQDRIVELFQTVFLPRVSDLLDSGLENYTKQIAKASLLNQARWNITDAEESTEKIRSYLEGRMIFLNDLWIENGEYYTVQVSNGLEIWGCYAVRPGEKLLGILAYENSGWYKMNTDEPYDITQPVYEDAMIYLKRNS